MILNPVQPVGLFIVLAIVLIAFATWRLIASQKAGLRLAWALRILMVILLLIVALRPTIPATGTGPQALGELEVWFAVDTTSSMAAQDYGDDVLDPDDPNSLDPAAVEASTRLAGAKSDIAAIAHALPGASYSLVTFDAAATRRVPLTTDASALTSASSVLTQEVTIYSHGSSIDEPVETLVTLLKAAAASKPANSRVLFYLGDGEQTTATPPGSFDKLAPLIDGGGVLGYGTGTGGRMLSFDGYSDDFATPDYIQDYSQSPPVDAVSKIDETALGLVAEQLGVPYFHRTGPADIESVLDGISVGELTVEPGTPGGPVELYWIVAIALGLLALTEVARVTLALRELRRASRPLQQKQPTSGGAR
jgi:Ca-activated chloride channel family protein